MTESRVSKLLLSVLTVLSAAGCSPEPPLVALSPQAQQVRVENASPPAGAVLIGPLKATDGSGCGIGGDRGSLERATATLKEAATRQGVNFVKLLKVTKPYSGHDCYHLEFTLEGLGFRLGGSAAPVASTPPAAAPCVPPCSPGYACEAGVCQALCTPACASGQTCRADRVCVPAGP